MNSSTSQQTRTAFEAKSLATTQMINEFTPIQYTDLQNIPDSGTANYAGFLRAQLSNVDDNIADAVVGDLRISVAFGATEMVTGNASGFLDEEGDHLAGELTLFGGFLDRAGNPDVDATVSFGGSGELIAGDGAVLALDVDFDGDFLGEGYEGIGGSAQGQVTVSGETQNLGGVFIAKRDTNMN